MGRKDLKNRSRQGQGNANLSKQFFARLEFSKSAEFFFFPFIKSFKIIAS